MVTGSCDGTRKPKTFSATSHPLPVALTTSTSPVAPTCSTKAAKISEWHAAMIVEFEALQRNRIWSFVPPCPHMNIVGCKWVYRLKYNVDGSIELHKARLVAKSFHQQPGIDFFEAFSLMDKPTTIRIVLLLAVQFNWPIHQLDIKQCILNGDHKEEVYMQQPQGFVDTKHQNYVCRLHKSLYGLKQARGAWFEKFTNHLNSIGFQFVWHFEQYFIILLLCVDEILITKNNVSTLQLIKRLAKASAMKDLSPLHYFLGP